MSGKADVLQKMSKMFSHTEVTHKNSQTVDKQLQTARRVNFPLTFPLSAESEAGESEANFSVVALKRQILRTIPSCI